MIAALFTLYAAIGSASVSGDRVYRCTGAHGETVFSGQPCRNLAAPLADSDGNGFDRQLAWGGRCPASEQELSDRVAAAFDSGNINALSGLFLWRGYGSRAAYRSVGKLQSMLRMPLAGLSLVARPDPNWWQADPARMAGNRELRVEVAVPGMGDAIQTYQFPVLQSDACYWLQYADRTVKDGL